MSNATIIAAVKRLCRYAEKRLGMDSRDSLYFFNRILSKLRIYDVTDVVCDFPTEFPHCPDEIIAPVLTYAEQHNIITEETREAFSAEILGMLSLKPSEINDRFAAVYAAEGPSAATDRLHAYGIANDYVKASAIARNKKWETPDGLKITINLSKPEKSNKATAALLNAKKSGYPACQLCAENIGFCGHGTIRQTIRTVDITLNGEPWFWQFSPYAYFYQHGIAVNREHIPMKVDKTTVVRLLDFVDIFPHYFIGSNAALPRVGGSILNHDHYQGGGEILPMQKAVPLERFFSSSFKGCTIDILDWFNSALRISGEDRQAVTEFAAAVCDKWEFYDNAALDILSHTGEERHNIISPVARKTHNGYIVDIILRNNRTDERYPDGIFHAHSQYHNIKSESIGLIEAMGLFILPARLDRQLKEIEGYLCQKPYDVAALADDMKVHENMIESLLGKFGTGSSAENARKAVTDYVNEVCKNILFNTAVFKKDESGMQAFRNFVGSVL